MLIKNLEETLTELTRVPEKLESIPYVSKLARIPASMILDIIGFNNYREHSVKGTNELSKSISTLLLEPITISYNTQNSEWDFIDGEGRFWGCYQLGAKDIPVEIFFDVPEDVRNRMKTAANATKTKIDPEDIAIFTVQLKELLSRYKIKSFSEISEDITESYRKTGKITKTDIAHIIGRHEGAVSDSFAFVEDLHKQVFNYINNHRDEKLYSKGVKITKKIKNKPAQLKFFGLERGREEQYRKELERERTKKGLKPLDFRHKKIPDKKFSSDLKKFSLEYRKKEFVFGNEHPSGKNAIIRELVKRTKDAHRYVQAFTQLITYYPEMLAELKKTEMHMRRKNIVDYLSEIKSIHKEAFSSLPEGLPEKIYSELGGANKKGFRQKILEQAALRREKTASLERRIETLGESFVYIPINQISLEKSQLRSRYIDENIENLSKEMAVTGQIKSGLVKSAGMKGGKQMYKVIFGHNRYFAAKKAGIKYFKAFIRDDFTRTEIALLQAMEDLSEQDSPIERARVLFKQYNLAAKKAELQGRQYSKEDFVKEYGHLGKKNTLYGALSFMELDESLRDMATLGLIGYNAAITIGKLDSDSQLEILYKAMTANITKTALEKDIARLEASKSQEALFAQTQKNYSKVFEMFEAHSSGPYAYLNSIKRPNAEGANSEVYRKAIGTESVLLNLARLYMSILSLEKVLNNGNGHS